jgi:hypothetical protein
MVSETQIKSNNFIVYSVYSVLPVLNPVQCTAILQNLQPDTGILYTVHCIQCIVSDKTAFREGHH